MQLSQITTALAALSIATASALPRKTSSTTRTLRSNSFTILSYAGGFPGNPIIGYVPPSVSYRLELNYGEAYAGCSTAFKDQPLEAQCGRRTPRVNGFKTTACETDSPTPLNNVTWSITRYGDRFVAQLNLPDPETGEPLVACDEFSNSQFQCTNNGYYEYAESPNSPYYKNLTASVGNVCPTY